MRAGASRWKKVRKLLRRFDPTMGGRRRNVVLDISNPSCMRENQLHVVLERWEAQIQAKNIAWRR